MSVLWFGGFFRRIAVTTRLNANLLKVAVLVDHRVDDSPGYRVEIAPGVVGVVVQELLLHDCQCSLAVLCLCCLRLAATGRAADTTGSQD